MQTTTTHQAQLNYSHREPVRPIATTTQRLSPETLRLALDVQRRLR